MDRQHTLSQAPTFGDRLSSWLTHASRTKHGPRRTRDAEFSRRVGGDPSEGKADYGPSPRTCRRCGKLG